MSERSGAARRIRRCDRARAWVLRIAAVLLFVLTLEQWVRLVGILDGPFSRFDLMPPAWRLASASLAVLYPVAGLGLWMLAPWGPVIWALVAATLAAMHLGFPETFGGGIADLVPHAVGLTLLIVIRLLRSRAGRQGQTERRNTAR